MSNDRITRPVEIDAPIDQKQLPRQWVSHAKKGVMAINVANIENIVLRNTVAQAIADFTGGQEGQTIKVLGDGYSTINHNTNIKTNTGAAKLTAVDTVYLFTFINGVWVEAAGGGGGGGGGTGPAGPEGDSAYEVAVNNGFVGTEVEWLASLEGPQGDPGTDGDSAYQVAVNNGFVGTEAEWLESLVGPEGPPGTGGGSSSEWDTTLTLAADFDVVNTTVPATAMTTPIVAAGLYLVEFFGMYTGSDTTGDFKWRLQFPALLSSTHAIGYYHGMNTSASGSQQTAPTGLSLTTWPSPDAVLGTNNFTTFYLMQFRVFIRSNTAGDLELQIACNSAGLAGRTARLLAGSILRLKKLN